MTALQALRVAFEVAKRSPGTWVVVPRLPGLQVRAFRMPTRLGLSAWQLGSRAPWLYEASGPADGVLTKLGAREFERAMNRNVLVVAA